MPSLRQSGERRQHRVDVLAGQLWMRGERGDGASGPVRVAAAGQGDGPHREHGWTPARRVGQSIDRLPRRVEAAVEHVRAPPSGTAPPAAADRSPAAGRRRRARPGAPRIGAGALLEQPPEVDVGRRRSRLQADGRLEMILGGPRLAAPRVDHAGEVADDGILGKRGDAPDRWPPSPPPDRRVRGRPRSRRARRAAPAPAPARRLGPGPGPRLGARCGQRENGDRGDDEARAGHGFDAAPAGRASGPGGGP